MRSEDLQDWVDSFYHNNGPCCAGCDHWRYINSAYGECLKSKIVSGKERGDVIGFDQCSMRIPAGHALTERDYVCGNFIDNFDWSSLPLAHRKRIGASI